MLFAFYPLRFEFIALGSLSFPPGKAANVLRGALGSVFKLSPARDGFGPSGLADPPRPYVFRARHLDGVTVLPGQSFHFDLNVFAADRDLLSGLVLAFRALAAEGIGPGRGKAALRQVVRRAIGGVAVEVVTDSIRPVWLDLEPSIAAPRQIRVEFLTPTELKHEQRVAERPEFPILFGRIRDRISTLRGLYGEGPLPIDFQGSGVRAASVRMTSCEMQRVEVERRSGRTGQSHSIGGFVGFAEYEGDLGEFLPYLEAARWTGVGRQSVWGKGEIALASCAPFPQAGVTMLSFL